MPAYVLTDPVYGRKIKVTMEGKPTQEQIRGFFQEAFPEDREFRFTDLAQDKNYVKDLRDNWKAEGNEEFEGSDEDLIERDFEYWNSVEFNLGKGALELATTFANLEPEEAQRMLRRFDTYDRTSAFGEGSRDFSEQLKGVTWSMITDPTTYVGGYGVIKNLVASTGAKGMLRSVLMKAAGPTLIGGAYGAAADAEHQAMLIKLGAQEEFDPAQTGRATALGAATSVVAPVVAKGVAKTAKGLAAVAQPTKWKAGVQKAEAAAMETMGGAQAAIKGVTKEGQELLAHGGEGHADAAMAASNRLNDELNRAWMLFDDKYDELGEIAARPDEIIGLVKKLDDAGIKGLTNIKQFVDLMQNGVNTPTRTLRLIRSQLGKLHQSSKVQGNANEGADIVLGNFHKESKAMFSRAAQKAGKGQQAKQLDNEYAEFMGVHGNNQIMRASGQSGKASDLIAHVVSDPKKSYIRVNEYLSEIGKIGKASANKEFVKEQKQLLGTALSEKLFEGEAGTFKKFVANPSGKKTLLALYDDITPKSLDRWATILDNAAQHGGASTFWGRILSQTFAGGIGAAAGGLIGAGISFIAMAQFLKSSKFQDMAMRVYAKKKIDQKALSRVQKYLVSQGLTEGQAKWFGSQMAGLGATKAITAEQAGESQERIDQIKTFTEME